MEKGTSGKGANVKKSKREIALENNSGGASKIEKKDR